MEAKDTVMKGVEVNKVFKATTGSFIPTFANYGEEHPDYKLLLAQAEISFKAGRDSLIKILDQTSSEALKMVAEVRLAGIKEVVEWGDELCPHGTKVADTSDASKRECELCWQSKLKSWNI